MKGFSDLGQATAWVFNLQKYGIKFGLSSTYNLLQRLGLPYEQGRYLHIAGTNGKGSVAAMLSAVYTQAGYPVGLFTSPHLVHFSERYRLKEQEVSPLRLLQLINRVREAVVEEEPPTFFEFATAMAFLYFLEEQASPIILETGMGGRLDATNIIHPEVSVITNISLDHQEFLGRTLMAIAREKAGIIKPGAPVVTGVHQKRLLAMYRQLCREAATPLYVKGVHFQSRGQGQGCFSYHGLEHQFRGLTVSLAGRHQFANAALALAVLEVMQPRGFPVAETEIREGLRKARWPGRLEQVRSDPRVWLDGAHNPAAAQVLAQRVKESRANGRLIMVLGMMADKDTAGILGRLLPLAHTVIFTRPRYARAAAPERLALQAESYKIQTLTEPQVHLAIRRAQTLAGPQDRILVTGSLYTVGEAKEYFDQVRVEGHGDY